MNRGKADKAGECEVCGRPVHSWRKNKLCRRCQAPENSREYYRTRGVVDGRGAPVLVHDEVVTSSQAQDAKSGVKNSPPSTKEKGATRHD